MKAQEDIKLQTVVNQDLLDDKKKCLFNLSQQAQLQMQFIDSLLSKQQWQAQAFEETQQLLQDLHRQCDLRLLKQQVFQLSLPKCLHSLQLNETKQAISVL